MLFEYKANDQLFPYFQLIIDFFYLINFKSREMIKLEGEITETATPPNKAGSLKTVSIWFADTQETMDFTFQLDQFKNSELKVGDKVTIQIDKQFDVNAFTENLFKTK